MGKLALLLELCQALSSTAAKLVSGVWKWSLWRSDDLCFIRFGVLEPIRVSGIAESCCAAGHQTALAALANVLETCLKNIKFPDYDHLIMNTHQGTKLELNLTSTDVTLACERSWRFDTHRFLGGAAQKNLCPCRAWSSCCLWWTRSGPMADIPCCTESAPACCSLLQDSYGHLCTLWKVDHTKQWEKNCSGFIKICWAWLE